MIRNDVIEYRGYHIHTRVSWVDGSIYYAIRKDGKLKACVNTIEIAKINIDEWLAGGEITHAKH